MLFNSYEFIFLFLPVAVAAHFLAARFSTTAALVTTTVSSLIFYAWWKPPFVLLPMLSIALNFLLARRILATEGPAKTRLVVFGVAANVALLAYFKYYDLPFSLLEWRNPNPPDVPLALSFTTFVQVAFLVELARRPSKVALPKYAMFVAFFPHLIAGPIVRWTELGPQLDDQARFRINWDNVARGLTIFCMGLVKKILLADQLAPHVARVYDAAAAGQSITAIAAWGSSVAFSLQIYFDFSGYSDMAIGLGLLFNLRLPLNFAAPLRSTNINDLWRRWHISLSRFLGDFVFTPLSRLRFGGPKHRMTRALSAIMFTMIIGGLWHGANWTFLAWGGFHGSLLLIYHYWNVIRGKKPATALSTVSGWFLTYAAFVIGAPMFRSGNVQTMGHLLAAMAGFGGGLPDTAFDPSFDASLLEGGYLSEAFVRTWLGPYWSVAASLTTLLVLAVMLVVPDTMEIMNYRENEPHAKWRRKPLLLWQPNLIWLSGTLTLFAIVYARLNQFTEFLYYQF